ncbi:MAG: 5-bromo-4-chloroindolyl phosphate hydrolysis family protein [Rhodosalinus sp.]
MARRYGGKHSPDPRADGSEAKEAAKRLSTTPTRFRIDPGGARVNFLYLPAAVLAFMSLGGGPERLALGLVGGALWALAAWLTREGLRAEAAYHDRKVARRPALPRKILASLLTGAGTVIAAGIGGTDLLGAALYGVIGTALHVTAFGIDPLFDKGVEGVDRFQQDRVARAVDEAEGLLAEMRHTVARLGDRPLETRVERFERTAQQLFRTVEQDPRDLTSARRFLSVYLMGARDATLKYAGIAERGRNEAARRDYLSLLDDLEQNFAARTRKLLQNDRADLNVEIEVLRDRLKREGLRTEYSEE